MIIFSGHIDIDEPGQEAKLEAEISKVFHSYLNNIDQDCLGLSDKSIINTHASEGVAVSTIFSPSHFNRPDVRRTDFVSITDLVAHQRALIAFDDVRLSPSATRGLRVIPGPCPTPGQP